MAVGDEARLPAAGAAGVPAAARRASCCSSLVLVPGSARVVGGARRWFRLPGFELQPAELAKFAWVIYLALLAGEEAREGGHVLRRLPAAPGCSRGCWCCSAWPSPTSAPRWRCSFLLFVLLFAAGTKLSYLVGSVLLALPLAYHAIAQLAVPACSAILAFLDPWAHRHDIGYQITESLMSIGSGGVSGLGPGRRRQKLFFLPEAHTDFIFSHHRRGAGPPRRARSWSCSSACSSGAACARRSRARETVRHATSALASPRCSGSRRW